jgi:hypothetical protein
MLKLVLVVLVDRSVWPSRRRACGGHSLMIHRDWIAPAISPDRDSGGARALRKVACSFVRKRDQPPLRGD